MSKASSGNSPTHADSLDGSVLITGATSYLGVRLVHRLLDQGRAVGVVARSTSPLDRLGSAVEQVCVFTHDGSIDSMLSIVDQAAPSCVVHLATRYVRDHEPADLDDLIRSNILFGTQLLEGMRQAGCRRLITAGSGFQRFDSDSYRPVNLYAATKQAFWDLAGYYADAHEFDVVGLILFEVFGPGDWRPKLVDAMRRAAQEGTALRLPSGDPEVDLVHVDDVVAAFTLALELLELCPEAVTGCEFAVSSGLALPLSQVVDVFEQASGSSIRREPGAFPSAPRTPKHPWNGPSLPGWTPRLSLLAGFRDYLAHTVGG